VSDKRDERRVVLPIPERVRPETAMPDANDPDQVFPKIEPVRPPDGAPNVLVVLLDDVGFGASASFGGLISTPTAERLAGEGLRYTRFHTTALCAPTRAAMLTGRNHHTVNMGAITELATSAPGQTSMRPASIERLLDRPIRKVSRSSGVGDLTDGTP
jgi:arylsulfatase